jgi:hypothetical protein
MNFSFVNLAKDRVDFMLAHDWKNKSEATFGINHSQWVKSMSVARRCIDF